MPSLIASEIYVVSLQLTLQTLVQSNLFPSALIKCCLRKTPLQVLLTFSKQKIMASAGVSRTHMARMHNAGAAALVMHRGHDNVKTSLGIGLLFSVRSQLVGAISQVWTQSAWANDWLG